MYVTTVEHTAPGGLVARKGVCAYRMHWLARYWCIRYAHTHTLWPLMSCEKSFQRILLDDSCDVWFCDAMWVWLFMWCYVNDCFCVMLCEYYCDMWIWLCDAMWICLCDALWIWLWCYVKVCLFDMWKWLFMWYYVNMIMWCYVNV